MEISLVLTTVVFAVLFLVYVLSLDKLISQVFLTSRPIVMYTIITYLLFTGTLAMIAITVFKFILEALGL